MRQLDSLQRSSFQRSSPTRRTRGYTVVELMMAITIFAIGVTGVLALQLVATSTNSHAKNVAVATQLARSWQEQLAMDALNWGVPAAGNSLGWQLDNTRWLSSVDTQNNTWHLPVNNTTLTFGPGANALGGFVNYDTDQDSVVFCTHIRLTRLLNTDNAELLRSEVRVFWPKGDVAWNDGDPYCELAPLDVADIGASTNNFHFVYQTSAIRETPSF